MKLSKSIGSLAILAALMFSTVCQADLVESWDFNTDGDFEGWTTNNVTAPGVAGGFFTGVADGNDPQLSTSGLSLDAAAGETWSAVTFIVEETDEAANNVAFNPTGIVVALNGGGGGLTYANTGTAVDLGNGSWEVTVDISSAGTTTITSMRVDPIGGADSNSNSQTDLNTFSVDRIQVLDTAVAVPEPGTAALLGVCGFGLIFRRKRS